MFGKALLSVALLAVRASATIWYAGVAEAGGEFGVWSPTASPVGLPGTLNVDYAFISKPAIDIYVDQNKVNLFRVAFLLERMCPLSLGLGARFSESHFAEFADAVNYITVTKKAYCILDPHNYMRYNNPHQQPMTGSIIGDTSDVTAATTAQFAAFWGEMARRFVSNEKVIFGLMNEPHDMDNNLVLTNNQAAINAIRATGAKQLILAPGGGWTGGHSWTTGYTGNSPPNSEVMVRLTDSINNTAFDIHEYLDTDFSGGHALCEQPAATNLAGVTSWLRTNGFKAMITEFGGSNGTQCASYITDMVNYMAVNPEYIGWTAWAAGPIWGTYSPCCTDSRQWGSLEPGSVASDGTPSLYTTVWLRLIQPLLPSSLQRTGVAHVNGPAGGVSTTSSSTTRSSTTTTSSRLSTSTTRSTTVSTTTTTTTLSRTSSSTTVATTRPSTTVATTRSSTTSSRTTSTVRTTTSASSGGPLGNHWDQCGGSPWSGPVSCVAPYTCVFVNQWYSQCL